MQIPRGVLFFYSIWLVPLVLTLLAWKEGWRAIAAAEPQAGVRARTWPAMLFLAGPVAMVLGYVGLRLVGGNASPATIDVFAWMVLIGATSSVAAVVTSMWVPRRFRVLALLAAAAWAACFGFVFVYFLISAPALRGLR